jgi:hypothetical protein
MKVYLKAVLENTKEIKTKQENKKEIPRIKR